MQRESRARITLAVAFGLAASLFLAGGPAAEDAAPQAAAPEAMATARPAPETALRAVPAEPRAASAGEDAARGAVQPAPGQSGLRVRLDPQTGEILEQAADPADQEDAARVDEPRRWLNTYSDDLVQEPLPGGGFRVDLRGRFQSSVVATIDPETDEVAIDCVATPAPEEAADDE